MKNEKSAGEDLLTLQNHKGNICISVIIPTHRLFPERKVDKFVMEKAVNNAVLLLEEKYGKNETKQLAQKLHEMVSGIDFDHNLDGLGLFVADDVEMMVRFPFPVEEKIVVNHHFEIRDMLYKTHLSRVYYTLVLSEKKVRLYEGIHEELTEIKGKHFPFDFYDDWEYNPAARSSSPGGGIQVRSVEKDKSTMEAVRLQDFFRQVDEYLGDYMVMDTPLIITGNEKEIALFEKITAFEKQIIGRVSGSFDHVTMSELAKKCWPVFSNYLEKTTDILVEDFREKVGRGLGISGIQDIWTSVSEGKGHILIVEKDFRVPGFITENNEQFLRLRPPRETHETMPDAVDEIITAVLAKGGKVLFTENDKLLAFGRMVLIARY